MTDEKTTPKEKPSATPRESPKSKPATKKVAKVPSKVSPSPKATTSKQNSTDLLSPSKASSSVPRSTPVENKPMTPLQRRKQLASKQQAERGEVDKQRAAKAAAASLAATLGPRGKHPGISASSPTPPSITYQHLGLGEWVVDLERDNRLNGAAQRRLEVKVRTRKILARRAERHSELTESIAKAQHRIGFLAADTDFGAVRQDLLNLMANRTLPSSSSSSPSSAATTPSPSSSSPSSSEQQQQSDGVKAFVLAATGLAIFNRGSSSSSSSSSSGGGGGGAKGKNSGGGGFSGGGGLKDLRDVVSVFAPYALESPRGEALRQSGFKAADPNGNGLCSLAELETFVLKALLASHPKTAAVKGGNRGKDLFDTFRPCYIRAFSDAKDFKADSGTVFEGTKTATADDFVSKGEFKLFCAYLCIYAAMFDAFAKIDGGGSGAGKANKSPSASSSSSSKDRRIERVEFLKAFKEVAVYGFEGFKQVRDKGTALACFLRMDHNGGGVVLLDEWCAFLKAQEVVAGTTMGKLLAADEAGGVGKQDKAMQMVEEEKAAEGEKAGGQQQEGAGAGSGGSGRGQGNWDPTGALAALLLRLAFNSSATYSKGTPNLGVGNRVSSGGSNNCGLGGATLRFGARLPPPPSLPPPPPPLSSSSAADEVTRAGVAVAVGFGGGGWEAQDVQNQGLCATFEGSLWEPLKARHPKLSRSDLWVLASYVCVERLGGPHMEFVGGRFDAREASLAPQPPPPGPEPSLKQLVPKFRFPPTLLPPLDCQPDYSAKKASSATAAAATAAAWARPLAAAAAAAEPAAFLCAREKPTISALREWGQRAGLSDREVVALLVGSRGQKRGRSFAASTSNSSGVGSAAVTALTAAEGGVYWAEDLIADAGDESEGGAGGGRASPCLSFGENGAATARSLLNHHWIEVQRDSNAKFREAMRPSNVGERHFVSIGGGYEATVEAWAPGGGLVVMPTETYAPLDATAALAAKNMNDNKGKGVRPRTVIEAGKTFKFKSKKMSYYTPPSPQTISTTNATTAAKTTRSFGVIAYELCKEDEEGGGWVHDFDPTNPTLRLVKMESGLGGLPNLMAHARDLCLAWDPGFRRELVLYSDAEGGAQRLCSDFGVAFKRLTEFGFQPSADEPPDLTKSCRHVTSPSKQRNDRDTSNDNNNNNNNNSKNNNNVDAESTSPKSSPPPPPQDEGKSAEPNASKVALKAVGATDSKSAEPITSKVKPKPVKIAENAGSGGGSSTADLPPNLGSGGSSELTDFMQCFQAMAANGEEGKKLRKKGFSMADPNGNGLCSLAELEGFVLNSLLAKFPKDIKKKDDRDDVLEHGKDLFTAFRPCYIRAFADAKDYKADTGKVLEGTKKASADDFVSKGEFRLFCAYIVIYAAMFDAFAKIDGGGSGRDANDDRRIDLGEWLAGYGGIAKYGFVALTGMDDEAAATGVFKNMDDNGGGVVLLEEFCTFLKATEMKADTEIGVLLAADEAGGIGKQDRATKMSTP